MIFASWHDHPDYILPESKPFTFANLIKTYFENRSALGFRREGRGANVALGKPARVSTFIKGYEPDRAVDGNPETWWGSGDMPPQWIEVDLGKPYNIMEIRLTIGQSPPGRTVHRILVAGPGTGSAFTLLHTFDGQTQDLQIVEYTPAPPLHGIQVIRVETLTSPSWVSWREIEVIAAGQ